MFPACAILAIALLWEMPFNRRNLLILFRRIFPLFILGLLIPLFIFEIYRFCNIGGISGYLNFLEDEYKFIAVQTGSAPVPEIFSKKLESHFILIASSFGLSFAFFSLFLVAELLTVLVALVLCRRQRAGQLLFCLGATVLLYFIWWFAITSTNVTNRWLIPAFILLQVAYPIALAMLLRRFERSRTGKICSLIPLVVVFAITGRSVFFKIETNTVGVNEIDTKEILQVSKWISEKKNAQFYGRAFEPGSVVGLYSSTTIRDFCRVPIMQMSPEISHYFIIFPNYTAYKPRWDELRERYETVDIFPGNRCVKVIQLKPGEYHALRYDKSDGERITKNISVTGNENEKYVRKQDGHWISSDFEFLLKTPKTSDDFLLDITLPEAVRYVYHENIELSFYVNGKATAKRVLPLGKEAWKGKIKISQEEMKFPLDSIVSVRILSNNVCQFWRGTDEFWRGSQQSAIVDFLGFEDTVIPFPVQTHNN
jgi:hypothetical protein